MSIWESEKSKGEGGYGNDYGTSYGMPELSESATESDREILNEICDRLVEMEEKAKNERQNAQEHRDRAKSFQRKTWFWRFTTGLMTLISLGLALTNRGAFS